MQFPQEIKALFQLAIPLTLIQVAEGMVNFVDTLMMGWLGTSALAAGGLGAIIFWTSLALFTGLLEMTGALAAEAYGAKDYARVGIINAQALWLSLGVSIPAIALFWNLEGILLQLGQEPQIVTQTVGYLRAISWGLPAALGLFTFKEITSALMEPRLLTLLMIVSIPLNVFLNDALMYGRWGLPQLGLTGIGWSSALVFWLMFGIATLSLSQRRDLRQWQLFRSVRRLNPPVFREIVHLGWPLSVDYGTEYGALTAAALLMGTWSTDLLAAHRIVMTTTELLLMVSWGMSYATAMRTAHKIGEGRPDTAKRIMDVSLILNCVLACVLAIPLWLLPKLIVGFYLDTQLVENQATLQAAVTIFRIGVIFQIFQGFRLISLGTLQGLRDTHLLATIDVVAHWLIGLGGGYWLGQWLHWQGVGLWWGLVLGQVFAAVLLGGRVQQLLRQRIQGRFP
ncbi:MATE family efflux transporter [Oscillatoria sp. CS-180]|uniref:MATE family efflux transporter n=1 Tax=Oscillatoria sp. CS-180 TaxID=3021720 RepID=UPI00232BF1D0|nr:MATE family efflux transporter [Oscillatoria sp. CS-180]MDB9528593.1 MATE family efflux transporter [Oscillatoria sp. CS-180]